MWAGGQKFLPKQNATYLMDRVFPWDLIAMTWKINYSEKTEALSHIALSPKKCILTC